MLALKRPWRRAVGRDAGVRPASADRPPAGSRCCSRRHRTPPPSPRARDDVAAPSRLVLPSPLAVAAISVLKADLHTMASRRRPPWRRRGRRCLVSGRAHRSAPTAAAVGVAGDPVPIALLIPQSIAQMPCEPLGKGGAREFYTGISRPLILAVLATALAMLLSHRWQPDVAGRHALGAAAADGRRRRRFRARARRDGHGGTAAKSVVDPRLGLRRRSSPPPS